MIINVALFLLGIVLLIKGSDFFVKHSSVIAKKIGISEFIIGLTLVAIGTSLPELISSIVASTKNQSEIILGNVVGSNIANIGLIGGIIGILAIKKTKQDVQMRDIMIMIFTLIIFYLFILDGTINIIEGLVFLILYIAYIVFLLEDNQGKKDKRTFKHFLVFFLKFKYIKSLKNRIKKESVSKQKFEETKMLGNLLSIILSGVAIYLGARFLVEQTIFFGDYFGISKTIIGLSVIALGTSLPELGVSISAVKRGFGGIALGNLIGSNISNILLVLGVSSLINEILIDKLTLYYSGVFMLFISLVFWLFMRTDYKLKKREGIFLLMLYVGFLVSLILIR